MSRYKVCAECNDGKLPKSFERDGFAKVCPDCKRQVGLAVGRMRDVGWPVECVNPQTRAEVVMGWLVLLAILAIAVIGVWRVFA